MTTDDDDDSSDSEPTIESAGSYEAYFEEITKDDSLSAEQNRAKRIVYLVLGLLLVISVLLLLFVGVSVLEYIAEYVRTTF